ncbi:MAG: hypothetical protein GF344_20090 [Chitinivibrionales bacterium]|nr:hypothetical protein [Chitinivibrionales bacterium]MBD3358915.1 hypothetical protein [Chitinivibrionales bacterium]
MQELWPNESAVIITASLQADPDTTPRVTIDFPDGDGYDCDTLCFPPQIPGQYKAISYSRYVGDLVALDSRDDTIPFSFIDSSLFLFERTPVHIGYTLVPSASRPYDSVPLFSGIHVGSDTWIVNPSAAIGYIPQLRDQPIKIHLDLPSTGISEHLCRRIRWELSTPKATKS